MQHLPRFYSKECKSITGYSGGEEGEGSEQGDEEEGGGETCMLPWRIQSLSVEVLLVQFLGISDTLVPAS